MLDMNQKGSFNYKILCETQLSAEDRSLNIKKRFLLQRMHPLWMLIFKTDCPNTLWTQTQMTYLHSATTLWIKMNHSELKWHPPPLLTEPKWLTPSTTQMTTHYTLMSNSLPSGTTVRRHVIKLSNPPPLQSEIRVINAFKGFLGSLLVPRNENCYLVTMSQAL